MYDLVADVETYPDFIPWCEALRIRSKDLEEGEGHLIADMVVRYKLFLERFRSKVTLLPETMQISAHYMDGPFRKLENHWKFEDTSQGGSIIHFSIDFEFRNLILQRLAMEVFDKAFRKMSDAFIDRAQDLYVDEDSARK